MTNRTLQKIMFQSGCIFAALAVVLGAFGAHGLKGAVSVTDIETFETGVKYQFIHALAILMMSFSLRRLKERTAKISYRLFVWGIGLFCISLYILAIRSLFGFDGELRWIGGITPIGGLCFIGGWLYMAYDGYKNFEGEESPKTHTRPTS
jgi:uncharacterized membrane protein YgdD (TMEM256/DUF423 family)